MRYVLFVFLIATGISVFLISGKNRSINLTIEHATSTATTIDANGDIPKQKPLANPPKIIKAIYATGWSAGNEKRLSYLTNLIQETELNAIVIDVKDYTGTVSYIANIPELQSTNAEEARIPKINTLIKKLHDQNIYVIGRIAVFEDQKLPLIRPELALKSKSTGKLWKNSRGLYWLDTAAVPVWDYNIAIAKDMVTRGFDEINFDYIRFASDGNLEDIIYPIWKSKTPKAVTVKKFYSYLRNALPNAHLSADVFGMTTTNSDDLGIGQHLEDALPYFDVVAPMVYPSHYGSGFIGQKNPAEAPYEVVKYSIEKAIEKIKNYRTSWLLAARSGDKARLEKLPEFRGVIRPWLQDFNLGATYRAKEILAQIKATTDALRGCNDACDNQIHDELLGKEVGGWMLWNASNIYTNDALQKEATTTPQ